MSSHDDFLPAAVFEEVETDRDSHGLDPDVEEQAKFFGKKTTMLKELKLDPEEVQRSLDDLTAKLTKVLANQTGPKTEGFQLESFSVGLTLSATGKLLMIAEAGVEASVQLTFSRLWPKRV
jgi:hypothetical protein